MMMDERKFRILQAIIDDYILTAVPVGSRTISKKYDMGLSSATIRNEMSDLEELGYLDQPHVSAGRIPSAKAYRLYVDQLLKTGRIPSDSDAAVKGHFLGRMHQMEDVIDHAAQVLSSLTSYTAVVLPPTGKMPKIRTIQLVPVSDTSALVVIVTDMGIVRDQGVQVASDLDSDALYAISKTLTERLQGLTLHEAVAQMPQLMQGMHENERLLQGLGKALGQQDEMTHPHVAVGGTSNMLAYPEYSDMEKARSFLSLMETRDRLADILSQKGNGVHRPHWPGNGRAGNGGLLHRHRDVLYRLRPAGDNRRDWPDANAVQPGAVRHEHDGSAAVRDVRKSGATEK